jgi:hypothetical protein
MKSFKNKQSNILEFGFSSGMNLNYLYLQFPANHYYGVDISDVAIELGRNNNTLKQIINSFVSMLNRGGVLMINEAYLPDKPFGRIDNHRIYNTFNHDYFKLLNQFNIEHDKEENIFKCHIKE